MGYMPDIGPGMVMTKIPCYLIHIAQVQFRICKFEALMKPSVD